MAYTKQQANGIWATANTQIDETWTEIEFIDGVITAPQGLVDQLTIESTDKLISHFKGLYLGEVSKKLKDLDYDSLATVKLWEGDTNFGAEATAILDWYKAIIAKNYEILNAVNNTTKFNVSWVDVIPTDEEYLAELPVFGA